MKLTLRVLAAINLAAELHFGQKRKGIERPYIVHPFAVAAILSGYTEDDNVIAAGLLHDVLEDVPGYSDADLVRDMGSEVYRIVKEVTEDSSPDDIVDNTESWQGRKNGYLENLKNDSQEALMVCAADKIHNLMSLQEAFEIEGESIWKRFNAPKEKTFWFYGEVLAILKGQLKNEIVGQLEAEFQKVLRLQ